MCAVIRWQAAPVEPELEHTEAPAHPEPEAPPGPEPPQPAEPREDHAFDWDVLAEIERRLDAALIDETALFEEHPCSAHFGLH